MPTRALRTGTAVRPHCDNRRSVSTGSEFVLFIEFVRSNLADLPGVHLVIYATLMIVIMIYYPGGFTQLYSSVRARVRELMQR